MAKKLENFRIDDVPSAMLDALSELERKTSGKKNVRSKVINDAILMAALQVFGEEKYKEIATNALMGAAMPTFPVPERNYLMEKGKMYNVTLTNTDVLKVLVNDIEMDLYKCSVKERNGKSQFYIKNVNESEILNVTACEEI